MEATTVERRDKESNAAVNSGMGFEEWLYNWAMFIRDEQAYIRPMTQACVTVHIRSRGLTVSDMVSNYGTRPQTNGRWLQYDPTLDGEVHPIDIVGPEIRTNKNACLQSNSQTEVTSANASALHKQIAQRWQRFADYWERTGWNESKRGFIFDDVQKGGTDLVEVVAKASDKQIVPTMGGPKMGLAVFGCTGCGESGHLQAQMPDTDGDDDQGMLKGHVECPKCGEKAHAVIKPMAGMTADDDDLQTYEIDDKVISSFNFVIDMYGAKVGGLQSSEWLKIINLRDVNYMRTHYPGQSFGGSAQWSYQARADYALARGRWDYLNQQPRTNAYGYGHERYEEEAIFLHEDAYTSFRPNGDYEFIDNDGECTFRIKAGQSIGEAQEELYGENQHGFKFYWCEQRLLHICPPKGADAILNFRERFSDVHWNRESGAYLSSPNNSVVYLQDDLTLLNTKNHNIIARNDVNPTYFNSTVFEEADFSKEYIGSSKAALLNPEFDVRKHITNLPIPTPSPLLTQQIQFLFGIKDTVTQVTPAMRGETQHGQPFAAQRQQLEQSFGNLTSVLKSFAQCKCDTFLNKAALAKKVYTLEQFQSVGSMFGELWTEEDVREMCSIDLRRDLIVSYREGSEMPATPISKEMKFFGALQQLMPFLQAFPQLVGQDKIQKILQKLDETGGFDFDLTGLETNELIAQKRYNDLAALCAPMAGMTQGQIEMAKQKVVGMNPPTPEEMQQSIQMAQENPRDPQTLRQAQQVAQGTPITALDVITEQIFHETGIRFSQYEDLQQQFDFFVEMVRAETGKTKPNYMLIEMLEVILGLLDQALQQKQQEAIAKDPQAQAAAAADAQAKQDKQAELQLEAAKIQNQSKQIDVDAANNEADRQAEAEGQKAEMIHGLLTQAAEHEATAEANAPLHPSQKIMESINFKDLPVEGQAQLAKQAGIDITASQMKAKADSEAKAKAPAPGAKPAAKK